jgi:hypothetical protein
MIKRLMIPALLCLALLAAIGAGKPSSYGGGSYGARRGVGYAAGGAASEFVTVYSVFTMNKSLDHARVNVTNGPSYGDSLSVDNQDRAIVIADSLYALGKGQGRVYTLGVDDTTFAYAIIDTQRVAATIDSLVLGQRLDYMNLKGRVGLDRVSAATSAGEDLIIHFDPKVPSGATVVSATLHLNVRGPYLSDSDSVYATLMSHPNWNSWYHYRGQWMHWNDADPAGGDTWLKYAAKTGYTNQVQYKTAADRHGFHYATRAQWKPAISTLNRYYNVGDVTDITGLRNKNGDASKRFDLAIDMTDCVQAIANGATNNGIMITTMISASANRDLYTFGFEHPRTAKAAAWIDVKYTTKPYQANFPGGKTWAFVYQTDDARKAFNDSCSALFAAHGGRFTIYTTKNYINTTGIATAADLKNWHDQGMEIAAHGTAHKYGSSWQLSYPPYAAKDTVAGDRASGFYGAAWDSMKNEFKPAWIYALGDSLGISRSDRLWAKSMALPGNDWSPWTAVVAQRLGYTSVRVGGLWEITGAKANYGAAYADTARNGRRALFGRAPRNTIMIPFRYDIDQIVGPKTSRGVTEAVVKANALREIERVKGDNTCVLSLYAHDFKSGGYPTGSVDGDELGWILDVVVAEGGWIAGATEYTDWIRAFGVAVDRPASAHRDSIDFMGFPAASGVWYKPDGIDNRWLRNVR